MNNSKQDDLEFLRDERNWQSFPAYNTVIHYPNLSIAHLIISAFFELNQVNGSFERYEDITLDSTCNNQDYHKGLCVINDPNFDLGPVGARYDYSINSKTNETSFRITIYPEQIERICGFNFWDYSLPNWITPEGISFNGMLIQLCRDLYALYPFRIANLFFEDRLWDIHTGSGIVVDGDIAKAAFWPFERHLWSRTLLPIRP